MKAEERGIDGREFHGQKAGISQEKRPERN